MVSGEVALFVDFENIRYSFVNNFGQEPDPQQFMAKALKYGPVSLANAYADFTRHPEFFRRRLEVAGIAAVDVPIRITAGKERSSADLWMLMDIIDSLLDRPQVQTFVLMTGDRDFVRVSARLKNRFGKTVIISGVPGAISSDLVESASDDDPLEVQQLSVDELRRRLIVHIAMWEERLAYTTFSGIRNSIVHPKSQIGLTEWQANAMLSAFVQEGVLLQDAIEHDGRQVRHTFLNREHPLVAECLPQQVPSVEQP